jgi:hypothetical protein
MRIQDTRSIKAPIEVVWAHTLAIESWPQLSPTTMTSAERTEPGELRPGSTVRIKQPRQPSRLWTVTAMTEPTPPELGQSEPRTFAWSARFLGMLMTATHLLETEPGGTNNTLIVDIEGRMAPLIGPLLKRPIAKAIALENNGFKTASER